MVNAHIHTEQNTFRGRYPGLPLEVLMLYAYPLTGASPLDAEMIYHRTFWQASSRSERRHLVLDDVMEVPHQAWSNWAACSVPTTRSACARTCPAT